MPRPVELAGSPVRQARQQVHKTIAEASEEAGVNWQTWFLTENGCYEEIPGRIVDYLGRMNLAAEEYYRFRESKQRDFGEKFNFAELELPPVDLRYSPIQLLREKLGKSRTDFAKSMAVQTAHLYNCEKGKARFIPAGLRSALRVAGLSINNVDELDARQEEFYETSKVNW